ncbi:MAG: DUF1801 domain-containing protein [Muriicola sp.]|nr:DUF1801 domain-containing protein [Muriicola sp.]MBT8283404.1 DUF1801 domain-containing protein [Muriicola sp.]NNK10308.1 DUF1801 domain-containing protein [Flavobacteriaceae bacterium]
MDPASAYILDQPEPYRSILLHLQFIIVQTIPEVTLKFKFKIPFYYLEGRPFCYLNQSKNYVDVGFWMSAHLSVHLEHMTTTGRKMMRSLRYTSLSDIDESILRDVLENARHVKNQKFYK